jgi:hypothetical protein
MCVGQSFIRAMYMCISITGEGLFIKDLILYTIQQNLPNVVPPQTDIQHFTGCLG